MRDDAERLGAFASVASRLSGISGEHVERALDLHNRLSAEVSTLNQKLAEFEEEEQEYEDHNPRSTGFDIAALFSDL